MPECSLCNSPLAEEGGAVLFTDHRGIPFEICEKCTGHIDRLHADTEEDRALALEYISGHADNIENRGVYGELMRFVEGEIPGSHSNAEYTDAQAMEADEAPVPAEEFDEPTYSAVAEAPVEDRKGKGGWRWAILGAALVIILLVYFWLGGFRF